MIERQVLLERGSVGRVRLACDNRTITTDPARGDGGKPADVRTDIEVTAPPAVTS